MDGGWLVGHREWGSHGWGLVSRTQGMGVG